MKKVILYEPSIGSDNIGDQIIVDGVKRALQEYLNDAFVIELPTHTPINLRYLNYLERTPADLKIVCGSNIIVNKLNALLHLRQWNVPITSVPLMGKLVFVGVGAQQYGQKISKYTQWAYKKMMRPDFLHSVRDSYTEKALKEVGIDNVINTGCPTMWMLTEEFCKTIPTPKSENTCVFTLTDYKANPKRDSSMIEIIKKNYKNVYFWPQGNGDWKYFNTLPGAEKIEVINPNLKAYNQFLENEEADFIGTRLHGGMRALQNRHRTLIIGVDNRAQELHKDYGVPVVDEKSMDKLDEIINSDFSTNIKLPNENIRRFLKQFDECK